MQALDMVVVLRLHTLASAAHLHTLLLPDRLAMITFS